MNGEEGVKRGCEGQIAGDGRWDWQQILEGWGEAAKAQRTTDLWVQRVYSGNLRARLQRGTQRAREKDERRREASAGNREVSFCVQKIQA